VPVGDLLGYILCYTFKETYEKRKNRHKEYHTEEFEEEMRDSASFTIDVRNYAGKESCCRRAEVCPEDYRKRTIYGDKTVLGKDRECGNGDGGGLYDRGQDKTYKDTEEGIPEFLAERYEGRAGLQRSGRLGHKKQAKKHKAEKEDSLSHGSPFSFSAKPHGTADNNEEG